MKHLLVIAAFVAACCADVGERGYQYIPPGGSGSFLGGRPLPLGDEIPQGGHGTHRPQGGHGTGYPQRPQSDYVSSGSQRPRPQAPQQDAPHTSPGGGFNQGVSRPQRPFGSGGSWVGGQGGVGGSAFVSGQNDDSSTPTSTAASSPDDGSYEGGDLSAIPGVPGVDYPTYDTFPQTSFSCNDQQFPGYYADVDTKCQGYHSCHDGLMFDYLCPIGTIFNQEHFVCVWWNQFDCSTAQDFYHLNEYFYVTPAPPTPPASDTQIPQPGTLGDVGYQGSVGSSGSNGAVGFGGNRPLSSPPGSRPGQGLNQPGRPYRPSRPGQQPHTPQNFPATFDHVHHQGGVSTPSKKPNFPSSHADYVEQPGFGYPSGGQSQIPFGGQQQHYPNHNRPYPQADVPHEGYLPTY